MDNKRRLTNKYILLAILLIAVFVLPSCRTRISNNSEIANVQYDEDGMMSETYQERRDELGLSTAEKPLLPNLGSAETDDNDDFAEGSESIDYNPEDFQEDFSEPETTTETNTNTNTNTNTGTRTTTRRTPTTTRRTTGTTTSTITITFDPKEGTIEGKKKAGTKEIKSGIKKNSSITPPEAIREGYTLKEWKGSDGKTVKPGGKVTVTKTATYTAQWQANTPPETKNYKVTLNGDGGDISDSATIEEGKEYTISSDTPIKSGYNFVCWKDSDGNEYGPGSKITVTKDISLTAQWEKKEAVEYWQDMFNDASAKNVDCYVDKDTISDTAWIQDCRARIVNADKNPKYVIGMAEGEDIESYVETLRAMFSDKTIFVIAPAAQDSDKMLAYQIKLLNLIHDKEILDATKAAKELGDINVDIKTYPAP